MVDLGIEIDIVSGASVGALVAAFVADGRTGKELLKLMDPKILKLCFRPALTRHSLLSHHHLRL